LHEGESLVVSSQFLIDSESNLKAAIQQMQAHPQARPGGDSTPAAPAADPRGGIGGHSGHGGTP
jgi:hypothetical protein